MKKWKPTTWIKYFLAIVISLIALFPLYFTIVSSLKTNSEYYMGLFSLPEHFNLDNYVHFFWRYNVFQMLGSSFLVTVTSMFFTTLVSSLAGYVLAKFPFPGSKGILTLIISAMMIPPMVLLIPVFLMMSKLRLVNSYFSLILSYTALCIPFTTYMLTSNFRSIPDECIEAATLDGAGMFGIYWRICLPLIRPALITQFTLSFLWCWNEFSYAMMLLQSPDKRTLTVGVATVVGKTVTDMPLLYSGLFVNILPVLGIFIFAQKYLQKGMTAGAVKE